MNQVMPMIDLIQALWDQMRAELGADPLPQLNQACQALISGSLGSLTDLQAGDLEAVERGLIKMTRRIEGEPINWTDYSEAAHALRSPLNSTMGFSRLTLRGVDGPINEAQTKALETIYNGSRRVLTLFNLLLDALLLVQDEIVVDVEPVRADRILEELVAVGQALADTRQLTFETDVTSQVAEAIIEVDAQRLKQALSALLAVMVRYSGNGMVTLRSWLDGQALLIRLENLACQLPAPLLVNLCQLLTEKVDRSFPYDAHLRLGLAQHLINKMRGQLEAQQTAEMCTFTVTLPTMHYDQTGHGRLYPGNLYHT